MFTEKMNNRQQKHIKPHEKAEKWKTQLTISHPKIFFTVESNKKDTMTFIVMNQK